MIHVIVYGFRKFTTVPSCCYAVQKAVADKCLVGTNQVGVSFVADLVRQGLGEEVFAYIRNMEISLHSPLKSEEEEELCSAVFSALAEHAPRNCKRIQVKVEPFDDLRKSVTGRPFPKGVQKILKSKKKEVQ